MIWNHDMKRRQNNVLKIGKLILFPNRITDKKMNNSC